MDRWVFRTQDLVLSVDSSKGSFFVVHEPSNTKWYEDPWCGEVAEARGGEKGPIYSFVKAGSITLEKLDCGFRGTYRDLFRIDDETFINNSFARISVCLDEKDGLIATLEAFSIPEGVPWKWVIFPARFGALQTDKDIGFLVDPQGHGAVLPSHETPSKAPEIWRREDWRFPNYRHFSNYPICMAGMVKDRGAFFFTPETTFTDAGFESIPNFHYALQHFPKGRHTTEPRICANSPLHRKSLGRIDTPRTFRYQFLTGGYVEIAKAYRKHYEANKRTLVTLKERSKNDPRIERFVGAPFISIYGGFPHYRWRKGFEYTYAELSRIMRDMKENLGIEKALFHVWGMYEHTSADPFPWASRPGSEADLREMVQTAKDLGFLFLPYSYYTSYQPEGGSFDWSKQREMTLNYRYAHDVAKWHRISSRFLVDYATKHIAKLKEVGIDALQLDIVAGGFIEEDLARPPRTRDDDWRDRLRFFEFLQDQDMLIVQEYFKDWSLGYTLLYEGPTNMNGTFTDGFPIPLTSLAFHDVAHHCRFVGNPYNSCWDTNSDYVKKSLQDLCWGCPPIYVFSEREYPGWRGHLADSYKVGSMNAQRVGYDAMLDHRFLAEDFQAEASLFESGIEVQVNHGVLPVETDGEPLPGRGFRIIQEKKIIQEGAFQTQISLDKT